MWIPLNCHSSYSLLRGTASVEALVEKAMRFPALALTDTNATYGAVAFQKSALSHGIRPIFGAEVDDPESREHAVLLAKNLQGFGEICRVVTDRNLKSGFSLASRLRHCNDQVIILSPSLDIIDTVAKARGSRNIGIELIRWEGGIREDIQRWEFSHDHRIPLVASNRVFFPESDDWKTHRLLTAIRLNTSCITSKETISPEAWLKPQCEMERLYRYVPQALENTCRIAEQCDMTLPIGQLQFPPFDLASCQTHIGQLRSLAWQGVQKQYHVINARVRQRLQYELDIIEKMQFASYFLLVWDIVREAHRRGIPTVGRGSAANSLVCRSLKITEVDPIANNLYFERFLHEQREDFPDIDIDFPWNRRDEMIQYVFDKYENVALISTHTHLGSRSALREAGKALGISSFDIDRITKRLPHSADLHNLEAVRDVVPECRKLPLEDPPFCDMIASAQKIVGLPRHISIHCGGLVVSAKPITDLIPLQRTPKGFEVTQYDMYPVEDLGLLKIDLLSQRGLAVEVDTVRAVREHTAIDFSCIDPVTDVATKTLVREGRTMGCFYIESPGMRNLLQKLRVNSFEKLTAASSIIRPGVASSGMMQAYIKRHNGKETITYTHPKLKEVLSETYGIMIYQEDVLKVAHAIAGMSLGEAEGLRKCMSKKRDWERMETYKERFLAGAKENGISQTIRNEIWRHIDSFAGYSFCKAHSASFALVSYRAAYLKAHYPAEFMAAVLTNQGGFYDACAYIEEARRLGIVILPPHINCSCYEFFAEQPDAIRIGFMQVRGLSRSTIDRIIKIRKDRMFESIHDFLERVVPDLSEAETLVHCGALDNLGLSRPSMFVETLIWHRKMPAFEDRTQTRLLFNINHTCRIPEIPELAEKDKLLAEIDALELAATAHPMALYGITNEHWPNGFTRAKDLEKTSRKLVSMLGIIVTYKSTRTIKGELMKFVSLEDPTGIFEVTLFPRIYQRFGHILANKGPFVVKGRVEEDSGSRTVTALWLGPLLSEARL
jgi:DNA-directed DNA polymerase III PolC